MPDDGTPRDLGDGLVLRWSQRTDTEAIVALTCAVFRDADEDPAGEQMNAYTRQLLSGSHPLMTSQDFAVVEDTRARKIVACSCLLQQTWQFGDVAFPVGRPELVATDPAYRKRGLIRASFGVLHARSDARGDLAQGITGIRYFYRQFGYEYALELGGGRTTYFTDIPAALPGTTEAYHLRPTGDADVPFIAELYQRAQARSLISCVISPANWRAKVLAPVASDNDWLVQTIVDTIGTPAGYVVLAPIRNQSTIVARQIEVKPGVAMHAVALPLLRVLRDLAPTLRTAKPLDPPTGVGFALGSAHPWYGAVGGNLLPRRWSPYAWYVRIANLPRFILRIRPVLEQRLAASVVAGYSGELRLNFYRGGLHLVFAAGKLTLAEDWQPPVREPHDNAAFPPLVFMQLLLGYRDMDSLRSAYPDVWFHDDAEPLLRVLFPLAHSQVLSLD